MARVFQRDIPPRHEYFSRVLLNYLEIIEVEFFPRIIFDLTLEIESIIARVLWNPSKENCKEKKRLKYHAFRISLEIYIYIYIKMVILSVMQPTRRRTCHRQKRRKEETGAGGKK